MELVDRYLLSVKRYLPPGERDDIVAELSANLSAEIEDRESELGRSLDDAECEALLNAHGHPVAVAMRYRPAGQSFTFGRQLVGPELFPFYIRVLAANLVVACLAAVVAAFYNIPSWVGFPNILTHVLLQFAIVTIVFAVMQGYVDGRGRAWNERDGRSALMRSVGTKGPRRVSRLESISTLVWLVGSTVWLVDLVRSTDFFAPERGATLVLTPIWHAVFVPYALIVALEIVRNVVSLIRPEMVRFRAVMIASANAVSLVALVILLRGGPLIGASDPSDLGQVAVAHAVDRGLFISFIIAIAFVGAMIAWQIRTILVLRKASVRSGIAVGVVALAMLFLGGSPASAETSVTSVAYCSERTEPVANRAAGPAWNGWGAETSQTRFQPAGMAQLDALRVPQLRLKWAFGFNGATRAYGQPTVFGGRVFVGSENGHVYALNARVGCIVWDFTATGSVRTAISIGKIGERWAAYFGDQRANAYAVDAETGEPIWKVHLDDHPAALITGAPVLADGKLFVPVSSQEEALAVDSSYSCCTFRGSVDALDAATGKIIWKTFTIAAEPEASGKNTKGVTRYAHSGAAVWSAPVIDIARRAIYVATGDSYSDPAAATSDAVVAFDMDSGKRLWSTQMTVGDAENVACGLPQPLDANCPQSNGPDFDFGASPVLQTLSDGRRILVAGQKSGLVYGLDPDRHGAVLWKMRVGIGSKLGGVQWGMAAHAGVTYVAVSDVKSGPVAAGTAGAQPTVFGVSFALDPVAGGGLVALDTRTGGLVWKTPHPGCNGKAGCSPAQSAAVTAIPGIVFAGGLDGHLRAYAMANGAIVWDVDTERAYATVNAIPAHGGSLDGPGATVAGSMLFVDSGYAFLGSAPGNVLLAFSIDGK